MGFEVLGGFGEGGREGVGGEFGWDFGVCYGVLGCVVKVVFFCSIWVGCGCLGLGGVCVGFRWV
jgi:hypothetical protein